MNTVLCPDDINRMACPRCHKTYTPIGYSDDPDYGKRWSAIDWNNSEKRTVVEALEIFDPSYPVGYQWVDADQISRAQNWSTEFTQAVKDAIYERYMRSQQFEQTKQVRYV